MNTQPDFQPSIPGIEVTEIRPEDGGLLNRAWKYTPSYKTDIRQRFERIRQEQQAAREFAAKRKLEDK